MKTIVENIPESIILSGKLLNSVENRVEINGEHLSSGPSKKVWNHSPCGFAWGYAGSGPAQMALAILLRYLPEDLAKKFHQEFKREVIAPLPQNDFVKDIPLRSIINKMVTDDK